MIYMLGMTFALDSRAALASALVFCLVLAVRASLEDRTLRAELDGYEEYARRVRSRLVPGVW
jgi:protein-S-isoprenylcysteine O-methyltransferase Ste14